MSIPNDEHQRNVLSNDALRSSTFLVVTDLCQHNHAHSRGDGSFRSTSHNLQRRPKNDPRDQLMTQKQQQQFHHHHHQQQLCHLSNSSKEIGTKAATRSRDELLVDSNGNKLSGLALERALRRSRRASPSSDIGKEEF